MGAPRYLNVCLMSMICSVAVFAVTNSEPYVAVSTVACSLEYQSTGTKGRHPIRDLPVAKQWFKLALMVVVVTTASPSGSGISSGRSSWRYHIQSMSSQNLALVKKGSQVDQFVLNLTT